MAGFVIMAGSEPIGIAPSREEAERWIEELRDLRWKEEYGGACFSRGLVWESVGDLPSDLDQIKTGLIEHFSR